MQLSIKAGVLLDTLICYRDQLHQAHCKLPRGSYIEAGSDEERHYAKLHEAELILDIIGDLIGIPNVYPMIRTAYRWYEQHNWQECLPEEVAERLVQYHIGKQFEQDVIEEMLYVIGHFRDAEKNADQRFSAEAIRNNKSQYFCGLAYALEVATGRGYSFTNSPQGGIWALTVWDHGRSRRIPVPDHKRRR